MRTRNFRVRNDVMERRAVTKSHQGKKLVCRGKWESVFSGRRMVNVQKETHVVSVMTQWPLETVTLARDEKDHRLLLHPIRKLRLTARDKTPKESGNKQRGRKALQIKEAKFRTNSEITKPVM